MTDSEFIADFERYFGELFAAEQGDVFYDAMRYACKGGKRIRPLGVFLGASAVRDDIPLAQVLSLAGAIELIHSYSLVHDDLPAMDNDDIRRGEPTVHKKFGEANAILAGDALLSHAMTMLLTGSSLYGQTFADAAAVVSDAAEDMVRGQVLDLNGVKTAEEYKYMYALKTGALITAAFRAGATVAGAKAEDMSAIIDYAANLGLAFQIADDLIDGDEKSIVGAIGESAARAVLKECTDKAVASAKKLKNADVLRDFVVKLAERKK